MLRQSEAPKVTLLHNNETPETFEGKYFTAAFLLSGSFGINHRTALPSDFSTTPHPFFFFFPNGPPQTFYIL